MSTTDEPAFDWSQAASLLGDDPHAVEPDMAAIVRELVEQAVGQFKDLRALHAETERKTISSQAHALRGCLLNFGFTEVGTVLMKVEKGPEYSQVEFQSMLDHAETAFEASKKMLAERYPSVGIS
jgi:HPt (histidine-containing phosphotransfer) domain-containing protein